MADSPKAVHPLDQYDFESPTNRPLVLGEKEIQPVSERVVTDRPCLLIFLFCNVCLWTLSGWSYKEGDPQRLRHGWDIRGDFCGVGKMIELPFTYFPFPLESMDVSWCLSGCPVIKAQQALCPYDQNLLNATEIGCYDGYPSRPFFNYYCLPADAEQRTAVLSWLYAEDQVMTRVVGDIAKAWDVLALSGVVSFLAMVVLLVAFKCRCCTIPCYLLGGLVVMFLFAVLAYLLREEDWRVNAEMCNTFGPVHMDACDEGDIVKGYTYLAWATASLGFCVGLATLLMVPRLWQGHRILSTSAKAFGFNLLPCAFPCFAVLIGTMLYAYFITLLLFSVSTGSHSEVESFYSPWGTISKWEFSMPERILVFFEVGMVLWWFSFLAHAVEFVTAHTTIEWYFSERPKDMERHARIAVFAFFRYHMGTVLLAAFLVPTGRLLRNLFSALRFVLRKCPHPSACLECSMIFFRPYLSVYNLWFKLMTSDALAYVSLKGEPFFHSAKVAYRTVKSQDASVQSQSLLNSGNMAIWLAQLAITMAGVVFCAWWLHFYSETFRGLSSHHVTSVTAMACYELVITWFLAQVYGSFVRGVMHGGMHAALHDFRLNSRRLLKENPFMQFLAAQVPLTLETEVDVTKAKEIAQVAPELVQQIVRKGPGIGKVEEDISPALPGRIPYPADIILKPEELEGGNRRVPTTASNLIVPATAQSAKPREAKEEQVLMPPRSAQQKASAFQT